MGVYALMPVLSVTGVTAPVSVSTMAASTHSDPVAPMTPPVNFPMTPMSTNPLIGNSMESRFPSMPPFFVTNGY